jgi:hypothetical protein
VDVRGTPEAQPRTLRFAAGTDAVTRHAELEAFGRKLARAQGLLGNEPVEWHTYGQAAEEALRRNRGIPLAVAFLPRSVRLAREPFAFGGVAAEPMDTLLVDPTKPNYDSTDAAGVLTREQEHHVTFEQLASPPTAARTRVGAHPWGAASGHWPRTAREVGAAVQAGVMSREEARAWFGIPSRRRRIFSRAWLLRASLGSAWRLGLGVGAMVVTRAGMSVQPPELAVLGFVVIAPGLVHTPWRTVWRWGIATAFLALLLASTSYFHEALVVTGFSCAAGGILAARRWRLSE